MLIAEARWLGSVLSSLPDGAFPLVDVGCQTAEYRLTEHPWIEEYVFAPLAATGRRVIHVDLRDDDGVDVVADVTSEEGAATLRALGARTLLCSNIAEHVPDPTTFLNGVAAAVPKGGFLALTGPRSFPYHADPIDNLFRPSSADVSELIGEQLTVLETADLSCDLLCYYGVRKRGNGLKAGLRYAARLAAPFRRPAEWRHDVCWALRRPRVYCLLLTRS